MDGDELCCDWEPCGSKAWVLVGHLTGVSTKNDNYITDTQSHTDIHNFTHLEHIHIYSYSFIYTLHYLWLSFQPTKMEHIPLCFVLFFFWGGSIFESQCLTMCRSGWQCLGMSEWLHLAFQDLMFHLHLMGFYVLFARATPPPLWTSKCFWVIDAAVSSEMVLFEFFGGFLLISWCITTSGAVSGCGLAWRLHWL